MPFICLCIQVVESAVKDVKHTQNKYVTITGAAYISIEIGLKMCTLVDP